MPSPLLRLAPASWRRHLARVDRDLAMITRVLAGAPRPTVLRVARPEPAEPAERPRHGASTPSPSARAERALRIAGRRRAALGADDPARRASPRPEVLTITRGQERASVVVKPGQALLHAALAGGVELPFSCTVGGCGTCRAKLVEGEVILAEPNCLAAEERAAGWVLPCSAFALGPVSIEVAAR